MSLFLRGWHFLKRTIEPSSHPSVMCASPSIERIEAQVLRRQQAAFSALTLAVIAALLLLHTHFAGLLGAPSISIISILITAFVMKAVELLWLRRCHDGLSARNARIATAVSIVGAFALAGLLTFLTNRDETPYFVLFAVAILQCAYRFSFASTCITIGTAVGLMFGWAEYFYSTHPPVRPYEFLEIGMISVIYSLMGLVVWYLVNQLEGKQSRLYDYMAELSTTRQKLLMEEKLAAVGRLASGIAHEIRNPVGMIASSLSTANDPTLGPSDRDEMYTIATREARRLEALTVSFLTYARPAALQKVSCTIADILDHVVSIARVRAGEHSIDVQCGSWDDVELTMDIAQVEGALVNLALNAVEATPDGGSIAFRTRVNEDYLSIEVENAGRSIAEQTLLQIFEPFFTTKPHGTGLGLATARSVARAHGGDLQVTRNTEGSVVFTMDLPLLDFSEQDKGVLHGQGADRR